MAKERVSMRKVREVLRLKWGQGLSNHDIAVSCKLSSSTVYEYLQRARASGLVWPLPEDLADHDLERRLYPPPPSPEVAEQAEIVRRVSELFKLADSVEARVKLATARVEATTQAILAKAFRGELVPTDVELARVDGRAVETTQTAATYVDRLEQNQL